MSARPEFKKDEPPRLLAICPPEELPDPALPAIWRECLGDSLRSFAVLLRRPGRQIRETLDELSEFFAECRNEQVPCLLSACPGDPYPSEKLSSEGVKGIQLRGDPSEIQIKAERQARGGDFLIGRSSHGEPDRQEWGRQGLPDYTCFAPVFSPRTIQSGVHKRASGLTMLRNWVALSSPVLALGGIDLLRAAQCMDVGAYGVAGISLFFGPKRELSENLRKLSELIASHPSHGFSLTPSRRRP